MTNELQTLRLFSPLFPNIYPPNEWGVLEDESEELSCAELLEYEDEILALIEAYKSPDEVERGLAIYLRDDTLSKKVYSINPTVEEYGGKLWCVTEVQTHGELSPSEFSELTDWITGQFSDGWGEGLEQREIKTNEGELYVSFWDYSERFYIVPEEDIANNQSFGMTMGGR